MSGELFIYCLPSGVYFAGPSCHGNRPFDYRAAMKRFGYAADPICLTACALYVLNRWWLSRYVGGPFLQGYFNDLLLIPAALPFVLWFQRRLGWRAHDEQPKWREIALHLLVWSVTAEALGPKLIAHATGDWRDVVAYASGAVVAGCYWKGVPIA